jgi:WD40 repeat protein
MSNGELLAVGGETGEIVLFNVADGQVVRTLPRLTFKDKTVDIHRMQFLAGDREIAFAGVASGPGYAGVISIETGAVTVPFTGHTNTIMGLRASADGKLVVTSGGNQNEIYVWSAADGKTVGRLSGNGNGIWGVGWAKDGKSIAWGTSNLISRDGHTALEGVFRFDDLGLGGAPDESKYDQSLTQDKKYVVKMVARDEVLMGNLDGQPALFSLPGHEPIFSASVLPNRGTAVVCGARSLVLVDIASGKPTVTRHFEGHTGNVTAIAPSPDGKYFVTGSSDQTIRIWKPDQEDPFLSLFVAGQEWIAWTPQGYYACSAHGEGLIAWQVNNTAYKFPQVYPAARFRPSLYQPALLKYLLPAGELRMAMAMAERYDQALVKTTNIADIIPPEVTIDSPAVTESGAPAVIDQETCTVKASARGTKHPVTAMKLLVDGRPFQGAGGVKRFDKPQSTAEVTWEVPLLPGSHTFVAIAETGVSRNMSKVAGVTRSGTPPKPNLYMLAIGISEYPTHKLHYAASDAKLLTRTFQEKSKGVFPVIETKVITDAEATRKNIRAGMDWLAAKMTPKDVGIVMFSGHGSRDLNGKVYLVPVDINDEDPTGTCLSGDEFKSRLENMPGRLVAILDSCHSGGVTENSRTGRVESLARDLAAEDSGVIVMCASLGREYSIEDNRTKAGYYTFGLVEGLSGHADIDEDGVIYITELDTYASARVKQISFGMQNPTLGRPPNIRPFPLALVPKDKKQ